MLNWGCEVHITSYTPDLHTAQGGGSVLLYGSTFHPRHLSHEQGAVVLAQSGRTAEMTSSVGMDHPFGCVCMQSLQYPHPMHWQVQCQSESFVDLCVTV